MVQLAEPLNNVENTNEVQSHRPFCLRLQPVEFPDFNRYSLQISTSTVSRTQPVQISDFNRYSFQISTGTVSKFQPVQISDFNRYSFQNFNRYSFQTSTGTSFQISTGTVSRISTGTNFRFQPVQFPEFPPVQFPNFNRYKFQISTGPVSRISTGTVSRMQTVACFSPCSGIRNRQELMHTAVLAVSTQESCPQELSLESHVIQLFDVFIVEVVGRFAIQQMFECQLLKENLLTEQMTMPCRHAVSSQRLPMSG